MARSSYILAASAACLLLISAAQAYDFEEIAGGDERVQAILRRCQFGGDRSFLGHPQHATPAFSVRVSTGLSDDAEARALMTASLGDPTSATFWGRFDKTADRIEVLAKDKVKLWNVVDHGLSGYMYFREYAFDADNLCARFVAEVYSDDFPAPGMSVWAHVSVAVDKDGEGMYHMYTSVHHCHADNVDAVDDADVRQAVDLVCDVLYKRKALNDTTAAAVCVPALIKDGVSALVACLEQAERDADTIRASGGGGGGRVEL